MSNEYRRNEKRDKIIQEKYLSGISICIIAKEYKLSPQRIFSIVVSLGKKRQSLRRKLEINWEQVKNDFNKGMTKGELKEKYNTSYITLKKYLNKIKHSPCYKKCRVCKKVLLVELLITNHGKPRTLCKECGRKLSKMYYHSHKEMKE
jgi:Mor family transcriptional regulator